jgi:hypothetical protein
MKPQGFKTNRGLRGDGPVAGMAYALFVVNNSVEASNGQRGRSQGLASQLERPQWGMRSQLASRYIGVL